ncbi:helix-turn-helix domain-containing protein [Enterococcus sp. 669A]|uniref:Helix-turn-helix domain-containing protein n=1 Tax=Candidatus Enterococcus moelleringii TaxID=2815325 RepID=A0ABS3L6K2_9ENTE|nr:helix-turn-helix domain-containing protein [Enterococcus sp. 669A]MBO1305243.1 helix-turn-helix domain-containing protein [Enterococcus sp. 669A]
MLENYLEKNIFRQVYLCEQLYENRTIRLHELAEQLQVSSITIANDLEAIIELLEPHIVSTAKGRNCCTVVFDPDCSSLSLTQLIYQRSYFLRILGLYLAGERHWGTMAEASFISLSKVYHLRSSLRSFFDDLHYLQPDGTLQIPEKDYRYLLLSVVHYTNQTDLVQMNQPISQAGNKLIEYVEGRFFSRCYPIEEKQLILLGVAIGLQRAKTNPIFFTEKEKAEARRTPLFQLIKRGLKQLSFSLCHDENEEFYLYSLFNSRNYLCNNLELLQKDFEVVYQNHVQYNPLVLQLSQRLTAALCLSESNQLLFEKAFLPFIRSTWADMQLFQPEKICVLSRQQKPLYAQVRQLLDQWKKDNQLTIRWDDNLVRRLTINLSLLNQQPAKKIEVFIVAPSDFKYLYYHQQLEELLGEHFNISSMICNHLNEVVDDTFFCTKRVILCDSSLYQEDVGSDNTLIYSINCHTIAEVVAQLNQQVQVLADTPQRYIF